MINNNYYRAWQKKLHALVKDDCHKAEIYKFLWMLMTEEDVSVFHTNIDLFITFWRSQQPKFIAYFEEYYANRVGEYNYNLYSTWWLFKSYLSEKWALSYRHFEHKDTDTNMHVERYIHKSLVQADHYASCMVNFIQLMYNYSFHNKLKCNPRYLNHNVNRRCDDLVEVLLSIEVDMFFARKRKEVMSSTADASKKVEGGRHTLALSIDDSKVHVQVLCIIIIIT